MTRPVEITANAICCGVVCQFAALRWRRSRTGRAGTEAGLPWLASVGLSSTRTDVPMPRAPVFSPTVFFCA
jgi:hypothetical protein